ncbi:hypothetical protein CI109_104025 [Kwoniella shandongensis]|uniref:Uncharacterized protein n=1 Tax=Kwoniella shandongensis TaxID=1734106 RepID=A0A5M6BZ80_9TREE|nr:uncharacterized protein CI109_004089 [Kwoniella shandongensis]KAA5527550.1 hypothetical protein CI109_004089 [Kwoniella shandongensis]
MNHTSIGSMAPGPSRSKATGSWQPLPYIYSGFCVYPFHPAASPPPTPTTAGDAATLSRPASDRHRFSWSGVQSGLSAEDGVAGKVNVYEIPLDVGDEFFAFEEYRCTLEEDGRGDAWYRGYVVQAVSLPSLSPSPSSSASASPLFPRPEPSVLIGIFPAAVVHVRPGSSTDNGELTEAYQRAVSLAEEKSRNATAGWVGEMDTVKEEDEAEGYDLSSPQRGIVNVEAQGQNGNPGDTNSKRKSISGTPGGAGSLVRANRPKSLVFETQGQEEGEAFKEQPPLPKLTAGDSTIAGQQWPLVDEIACAIREWYARLPTYLANREYRLFSTVMQHIDALFLGRRQLLSQTLSEDELVRVRRECVSRLVKCNVAQGLEVIVRSLEDGSVMVVDRERAYTGASWVGGITCYVYQVQLAYIDLIPLDSLFGKSLSLIEPRTTLSSRRPFSLITAKANGLSDSPATGLYYHLFLDVRAFIANPCASGETAELFFSLYNKVETRFVTEEFCLVFNHLGSPARDSEQRIGKLRTLFANLKNEDLAHDTYLVCRIVRNGALKLRVDNGVTAMRPGAGRRSSLYGISENGGDGTLRSHAPTVIDNMTDDSFSVTSGYGGHRPGTIDTGITGGQPSMLEGRPTFRRPYGCAVLELPQLSKLLESGTDMVGSGVECNVPIYLPKDEATFATLHEDVIHRRDKEFMTSARAETMVLSLRVFEGVESQLVREHPSLLLDVPLSARLGFPDVVYPGSTRNDLYVKLWSASFTPAPASSGGSIRVRKSVLPTYHGDVQVTLEVRKADGTIVQDAILAGGSGEPPVTQYHSLVFHHNDRPTYGELVKIILPSQPVIYHLFLAFRSRGKDRHLNPDPTELEKPFAFAYLPLSQPTSYIDDGDHDLVLYQMENHVQSTPSVYLNAPAISTADTNATSTPNGMIPSRDRMLLRTYLCSNVRTQDDTLRALFAWRDSIAQLDGLCGTLRLFGFVSEDEIAKFVPNVLDSLFGILESNLGDRQDEVNSLVFESLNKVLAMTSDRRFPNFKNVLDMYIDRQFKYPALSFQLLKSMKLVMSSPATKEYRSFLKVWHLFFRFIIRSREHDRARGVGLDATSAHIEADFQNQTKSILNEINALMKSTDKMLIGTQTLAVQHYADILPDLAHVFQPLEIAGMVIAFADTLTFAKGSMATYKLLLLLQVVKNIFETSESRALLVPAIVRWIKPHLGRYDAHLVESKDDSKATKDGKRVRWLEHNRLAVTVLAWTVNKLQEWHVSPLLQEDGNLKAQEEENIEYCLSLLPSLYSSYSELSHPKTMAVLNRQRSNVSSSSVWKSTPDIFPVSHPFALISDFPPPSLLEQYQHGDEAGLPHTATFNCGLAETAVIILTLFMASPRPNISRWLHEILEIEGLATCTNTLKSTFDFCSSVIAFKAFPAQWLTLSLMSFSAIIKVMECVADLLEQEVFVPSVKHTEGFDVGLWTKCLELLCDLCGSEELALEEQTQQRRRAEWIIAGDLRDAGAELLMRLWNAIGWPLDPGQPEGGLRYGGYQTRFTGLAERILGLCLSSHDAMCETAVEILFSMIYAEYLLDGKFDTIETEIFAKLDRLFTTKSTPSSSDPTMRAYFVAQLRSVFESTPEIDAPFTEKVSTLLDEVELFIDLLLSLREIREIAEWKDERSSAIYRLMMFVNRIGRKDLYIRFVHQLIAIYTDPAVRDWLAAGLALKLHADLYEWKVGGDWVDQVKIGKVELPAQNEFARKEAIYYHVIDYFAEAEAYESALELCQELTTQHQKFTYDVGKLSELLRHQAKLWEKIGSSSRQKSEYFRVAYFGEFSQFNRDKDFVVRGQPWQRYSDFCEALQAKFPTAHLHRSKIPPPESIRFSSKPVIWVTSVTPEPDLNKPVFGEGVDENIQSYWRWNGIREWGSVRPYMRDQAESEAVLTWTEKTILTTKEELPGMLSRSEIINVRYEQIAPIETAIQEVSRATKNLRKLSRGRNGQLPESKMLGTAINGAVDSPINGGVKTYRKVFLDGTYAEKHSEESLQIEQLRLALLEYVRTIQSSLIVHKQVCRDIAFHEALRSQFYKCFPEEIALLPRMSGSTEDSAGGLDNLNGIDHAYLHPTTSRPHSSSQGHAHQTTSPRFSYHSGATDTKSQAGSYILPPLRVGPSPNGVSAGGSIHTTARDSTSTTRHAVPPPTGTTSTSSPRRTLSRNSGSFIGRTSNSNSNSGSSPANGATTNSGVGLGARAMSMIGISNVSKGTTTAPSEVGTIEGDRASVRDGSTAAGTVKKEKGLKRFGSLIRRGG